MTFETDLKSTVRTIPDYPKPGILFRDITTLLGDARSFRRAVDELVHPWAGSKVDKVAGIEARGFILGGAVAHQVSAGFVPIRKKGKLPHTTVRIAYSLEYGLDEMEMHADAIHPGERVILVDDLIATGGTAEGAHADGVRGALKAQVVPANAGIHNLRPICLSEVLAQSTPSHHSDISGYGSRRSPGRRSERLRSLTAAAARGSIRFRES